MTRLHTAIHGRVAPAQIGRAPPAPPYPCFCQPCGILGVLMQLDDADAGDAGKEKDARPPCGITRGDSDRRQCEKDEDDALGAPAPAAAFSRGADDADDALLGGAALQPAPAEAAADGDAGHHVARDAEARKVTRWDWDAEARGTSSGATVLLRLALLIFSAGGGGGGGFFLEWLGRRKHVHLRTPPPDAGSVAPFATLGRRGGGGRALLVCRGSGWGASGTLSLAEAIGAAHGGSNQRNTKGCSHKLDESYMERIRCFSSLILREQRSSFSWDRVLPFLGKISST